MKNTKCIVTLVIGKKFKTSWTELCYKNWKDYASKYGYDLIVFDKPLDTSSRANNRSPAWQKCLVLVQPEVRNYRQVVWIDADILINNSVAPCICSFVPEASIGGVQDFAYPTKNIYLCILQQLYEQWDKKGIQFINNLTPQLFYRNFGIETNIDEVFQTGVFVASPNYHSELFKEVYYKYEDKGGSEWNYEMRPLSYEIISQSQTTWLPYEFNAIVLQYLATHYSFLIDVKPSSSLVRKFVKRLYIYYSKFSKNLTTSEDSQEYLYEQQCLNSAFNNSYFCHFAGMGFNSMKKVHLHP
jgi:hypothetical protein